MFVLLKRSSSKEQKSEEKKNLNFDRRLRENFEREKEETKKHICTNAIYLYREYTNNKSVIYVSSEKRESLKRKSRRCCCCWYCVVVGVAKKRQKVVLRNEKSAFAPFFSP